MQSTASHTNYKQKTTPEPSHRCHKLPAEAGWCYHSLAGDMLAALLRAIKAHGQCRMSVQLVTMHAVTFHNVRDYIDPCLNSRSNVNSKCDTICSGSTVSAADSTQSLSRKPCTGTFAVSRTCDIILSTIVVSLHRATVCNGLLQQSVVLCCTAGWQHHSSSCNLVSIVAQTGIACNLPRE